MLINSMCTRIIVYSGRREICLGLAINVFPKKRLVLAGLFQVAVKFVLGQYYVKSNSHH